MLLLYATHFLKMELFTAKKFFIGSSYRAVEPWGGGGGGGGGPFRACKNIFTLHLTYKQKESIKQKKMLKQTLQTLNM